MVQTHRVTTNNTGLEFDNLELLWLMKIYIIKSQLFIFVFATSGAVWLTLKGSSFILKYSKKVFNMVK